MGMTGEFYTEPEHADAMKATFERWYTTAFQSLQNYVVARRMVMLPQTFHTVQPAVPSQASPVPQMLHSEVFTSDVKSCKVCRTERRQGALSGNKSLQYSKKGGLCEPK